MDSHHTIEDTGIALGTALLQALGDKAGIVRYGSCLLPMDETLALCAVDLGGRPYCVYDAAFAAPACGGMDTQMAREFFYAVSYAAAMNLHLKVLYGENDHHKLEAMFKAFAKALSAAVRRDDRIVGVLPPRAVCKPETHLHKDRKEQPHVQRYDGYDRFCARGGPGGRRCDAARAFPPAPEH